MDQFKTPGDLVKVDNKKETGYRKLIKFFAWLLLVLVIFVLGLATGSGLVSQGKAKQTPQQVIKYTADSLKDIFKDNKNINVDLFVQVWDIIHSDYFKKSSLNDKDIFYGALGGMINSLGDPHSAFLNPKITEDFTQELEGAFYGIGAEIGRKNGWLVIIAPLPDTPAARAGLRAGDKILAVDGQDVAELSVTEAVYLIRGAKNTKVTLTIIPKGEATAKDVSMAREKIDIPSVTYKLDGRLAIITVTHFNSDTASRFAKIAQKVINDNPRGIILDLRNNPGGLLNSAVDLASSWVESGQVVVREVFPDKSNNLDHEASQKISLAHFKTIVLINEGSASGAEILAGALQDYGLAEIIGEQSFGKGSVQQLISLDDGSSLKLTVAEWLTPKGRTIEGQGITPDEEVKLTEEDYNNDRDPQLDRAKALLNQ
jgi:carboxyl-terminal processing protease